MLMDNFFWIPSLTDANLLYDKSYCLERKSLNINQNIESIRVFLHIKK